MKTVVYDSVALKKHLWCSWYLIFHPIYCLPQPCCSSAASTLTPESTSLGSKVPVRETNSSVCYTLHMSYCVRALGYLSSDSLNKTILNHMILAAPVSATSLNRTHLINNLGLSDKHMLYIFFFFFFMLYILKLLSVQWHRSHLLS